MQSVLYKYQQSQSFLQKWVRKSSSATKYGSIIFILWLINSCTTNDDPSIEKLANYRFNYSNTNPTSIGGEYLKDSIYVQIQNLISPLEIDGFTVEFIVKTGGGSVDQQLIKTRKNGKAATRWKLGTQSFNQIVTARITSSNGELLPEVRIIAHGIQYNTWNEVDYTPISNFSDLASDTINHMSWMISTSKVYKQGSNFLDWQQINETKLNGAREIEIDKNGVVYIGTWYGELYKSIDHGTNWVKCTNPIPDRPYYFYFWITSDGDLWATQYERGLWHSKDGGMTWLNPVNVAGTNFNMNGAYRLKNGWLVSMLAPTNQKQEVMKSEDEGKNWSSLTTPNYPYSIFVTDKDEIIVFAQGMSVGIHKSTDLGKTYKLVHSVPVTFGTGSMQTYVHKFGSHYYMAIPGFGVLKTKDFEQFDTFFTEPNINGLYIDHTGSVAVMGWHNKLNRSFFYGQK